MSYDTDLYIPPLLLSADDMTMTMTMMKRKEKESTWKEVETARRVQKGKH